MKKKVLQTLLPGYRTLTTDGVSCEVQSQESSTPLSREEVLKSLPVSDEVCAVFMQRPQYVQRVIVGLESISDFRFHVEGSQNQTRVWRLA